jgi:HK97 family phage major capsid protein
MTEQIKAMREARAKLVADAQALIPKGTTPMTAEVRTKFNRMMTDAEESLRTIQGMESIERETRAANARGAFNSKPGVNTENREALRNWARYGTPMENRAAISTGSTSGVAVINQDMFPEVVQAQKSYAGVANIVRQWHTDTGMPAKTPFVNDTGNVAADITDGSASSELEPPITSTISNVDEFDSGYSLVTVAELEDADYDIEALLRDLLLRRIYRGLAAKLVAGSTNITSVITSATNAPASSAATTVVWSDLTNLIEQLDPSYLPGAKFVMNQSTKMALAAMTDSLGRPLFTASAGSEQFDSILGYPIQLSVAHPNMGSGVVGSIQFGNWESGYCLRSVSDIHLFRLTERFLPDYGSYAFLAKARYGGFALSAGVPPVYNLVNHA